MCEADLTEIEAYNLCLELVNACKLDPDYLKECLKNATTIDVSKDVVEEVDKIPFDAENDNVLKNTIEAIAEKTGYGREINTPEQRTAVRKKVYNSYAAYFKLEKAKSKTKTYLDFCASVSGTAKDIKVFFHGMMDVVSVETR
uniref:Uncharacterized protein n=1 Tax=Acyrthosiphon pisum TaxID=7029 RepID=C4WVZ1_ACYPI|nr:hypothetical protein [Acyrthosiphon pisum]